MAGPKLCQELLTCIFEHVLAAGTVNDHSPSSSAAQQFQGPVSQPLQRSYAQQWCEIPTTKRLRSASEQQTVSHTKQPSSKKPASAHGTLCCAARVCKDWALAATQVLYRDPGDAISRYEGLYLPHLLKSLRDDVYLRGCVRGFIVTASLEAGLWVSDYSGEGDLFCELIELCPGIRVLTVPSFEVSCRDRVVRALQNCRLMESFNIRVYLESSRRDPRLSKLIPYDSWKLDLVSGLVAHWPLLREMTVRHIPDNSYHLLPDIVLQPPRKQPYVLPAHSAKLTSLSLRETFIDDQGLNHLMRNSALTSLCLMSCQGITSSAITRQGLLDAIKVAAPTLKHLKIMTPWLPNSARNGEPDLVIDQALRYTDKLQSLCVAGYDVTNAFLHVLPRPDLLEELEIMDFELVTPHALFELASSSITLPATSSALPPVKLRRFNNLKRLAVWQRNAGVGRARVSNGFFRAAFTRRESPAIAALTKANILLATGWESRLISGSPVDFHPPHLTAAKFEELDRLSPV